MADQGDIAMTRADREAIKSMSGPGVIASATHASANTVNVGTSSIGTLCSRACDAARLLLAELIQTDDFCAVVGGFHESRS